MSRSRRGSASRATLERRAARRGSIGLSRATVEALRRFARSRGWTMERAAEAALWSAMLGGDR